MSPEAQRIAIAEACGWTDFEPELARSGLGDEPTGRLIGTRPDGRKYELVPRYLTDLNAMHEAEATLTGSQKIDCVRKLRAAFGAVCPDLDSLIAAGFAATFATAAERAEAFLRTLGKWEDSK